MSEDPIEMTADADVDDAPDTSDEAAEMRSLGFSEEEILLATDDSDIGDTDPKSSVTDQDEDEDEGDEDEGDDVADVADDVADDENPADADNADDTADADAGAAVAATGEEGSGDDATDAAATDDDALPPPDRGGPNYGARARTAVSEDIEAVRAERKALRQQWRDGDIVDSDDYDDKLDELSARELDLRAEHTKAELTESNVRHRWDEASDAFYKSEPAFRNSKDLQGSLVLKVDELMANDAWAHAAPSRVIAEAQRLVSAAVIAAAKSLSGTEAPSAPAPRTEPAKPLPKRGEARREAGANPTLGGAPAAEIEDGSKRNALSAIDDLEGDEYTNAVARLSDEEWDRNVRRA